MRVTVHWSYLGFGAIIAFLIGWLMYGLLGAIIITLVVLVLIMAVIKLVRVKTKKEVQ